MRNWADKSKLVSMLLAEMKIPGDAGETYPSTMLCLLGLMFFTVMVTFFFIHMHFFTILMQLFSISMEFLVVFS